MDFSVRRNKAIERQRAFDSLRQLYPPSDGLRPVYIGLGSVWFSDFVLAHREVGVSEMISIEADPIVARRAEFNRPFSNVSVLKGYTNDVLPSLFARDELRDRPWIVWLDYDRHMESSRLDEFCSLLPEVPDGSTIMTTFNTRPSNYGKPVDWRGRLVQIFGESLVTDHVPSENADDSESRLNLAICEAVQRTLLVQSAQTYVGYVPAISLPYKDSTPMGTVGGVVCSGSRQAEVKELVNSSRWRGIVEQPIETPPLTTREMMALQVRMPDSPPTRVDLQDMGFDLEEESLAEYIAHYLQFPVYGQLAN